MWENKALLANPHEQAGDLRTGLVAGEGNSILVRAGQLLGDLDAILLQMGDDPVFLLEKDEGLMGQGCIARGVGGACSGTPIGSFY